MANISSKVSTITQGKLNPVILRLAWPSVLSQILFLFPSLYDAFWLGKLGPSAQSAAGLATAVRITMISVLMALSGATGSVVTRYLGAKEQKNADSATAHGVLLMILSSGTLGIIGLIFNRTLMELAGADAEVLPLAIRYGRILFAGLIAMELVPSMGGVFTTAGVPQIRLSMMLWTVSTMIIAQPLLIQWLDLEGAILALVISHAVGMLWGFYKLLQAKYVVRINLKEFKFDPHMIWRILRITGPAILQRGFPNLAMVILMRLIAAYGAQTLAAWVIIRRISSFAFLIGMGISGLAGAMVGQNLGAHQPERARKAVGTITRMVLVVTVTILIFLGIFAPTILKLFSDDSETIAIGVTIIRLLAVGFAGQTVGWVFDSALVGAGDTVSPMVIYAVMWSIQLLLAYTLSVTLHLGIQGIWIALDFGWCVQAIMLWLRFKQGKWQYVKL